MHLLLLTLTATISNAFYQINGLTVTTYNLWNHMFNWNVRKIRIREMIHQVNSDIVALQEVRGGIDPSNNQVQELQAGLTSQFKWNLFRSANNVSFVKHSIHKDYPEEGLGLLSKLSVEHSAHRNLPTTSRDPDKNKRLFLHAVVKDVNNHLYSIIVVHLSYYRPQQCRNIEEIMNYIKSKDLFNVIVLGDFNTYKDFPEPVQMLLDGGAGKNNNCKRHVAKPGQILSSDLKFVDAWMLYKPETPGYTFSNMPTPGFESRPDRILVSSNLLVRSVHLTGNGTRYQQRYTASIHWERFCTIIHASYLSYQGVSGYPCRHDCGPHGSCQCGVCVAGGNRQDCLLPNCKMCSKEVYRSLVIHCVLAAVVLFHLSYAVLVIFVVAGGTYGETMYAILGCNCCLMNPKLFTTSTRIHSRKFKILRVCKCWPIFRLAPYVQLGISIIGVIVMYIWSRSVFAPQLNLAYRELNEELYPSDHLMLTADITL